MTDELLTRFPNLPHPLTYDAVEELVTRLRDDLTIAERGLSALRASEIAALEARLAQLRGAEPLPFVLAPAPAERVVCATCGRDFTNRHALSVHLARAHRPADAAPAPAPEADGPKAEALS